MSMDYLQELDGRIGCAQVNYHFNFSLKNRYLYVQTSKCACTFIKASLTRFELADEAFFSASYRHTDREKVVKDALQNGPHQPVNRAVFVKPYQLGMKYFNQIISDPSYFRFTVVRNPYTRVLSAFLDTVVDRRPPLLNVLKELGELSQLTQRQQLQEDISFELFLTALKLRVERLGWGSIDQHYRQQHFHISDDLISYSKIFRVEDFSELNEDFLQRYGQPLPAVQRGEHTKSASDKMHEYYSHKTRALVAELFSEDLARFDYQFPG